MANLDQRGNKNFTWRGGMSEFSCEECGTSFWRYSNNNDANRFCSSPCYYDFKRSWHVGHSGYISRMVAGKEIFYHREIAALALGRPLSKDEIVHHVNGDRLDNRHANLLICKADYHLWLHWKMSRLYMKEHFNRLSTEQSVDDNSSNSGKPKSSDMVIPSQASQEEGVETRRGAPILGEGIVQPTNDLSAAKAVAGTDPRCYYCGNT